VSVDGHIRVDRARLDTLPGELPPLVGAALCPETARWCGQWADGLITVNQPAPALRRIIDEFTDGGGEGKPVYVQVKVAWAASDEDALAGAFDQWRTNVFDYLHRFYAHQPDPNIANPAVRREIARIIGFWLELGVSGFRVDAVPFLLELEGIDNPPDVDPHRYLRELRAFVQRRRGDAILLGEVNLPPKQQRAFFGDEDADELHLVFNFTAMQSIYLGLARESAKPIETALESLPDVPFDSQWATFLRNHDELTLDQLSDEEREVNMADQRRDPDSLLNWFERLIRRRREVPELGFGTLRVIRNDADAVLSHRCDWDGSAVVAVHNLAAEPCRVRIPIDGVDDVVGCDDLLGRDRQELDEPVLQLTIEGYGYRWFRILRAGQRTPP